MLISPAEAANQAWSANIFTVLSDMFSEKAVSSIVGAGVTVRSVGGIPFTLLVDIMHVFSRVEGPETELTADFENLTNPNSF